MASPIVSVAGKITSYDPVSGELVIRANYPDWKNMIRRNYKNCKVELMDSRPLSDNQRKAVYAMLREISDFTGQGLESTKEAMKKKFLMEELLEDGEREFSLSNAEMSLVAAFENYLIKFILDFDIPCRFQLLDMVNDVSSYVYQCCVSKKCCICGKQAEPHHYDRIGMGRNRKNVDQTDMRMYPLCHLHHVENHSMPQDEFDAKYHLKPVKIDNLIKTVWGFKGEIERIDKTTKGDNKDA